jgi:hypothetical protein
MKCSIHLLPAMQAVVTLLRVLAAVVARVPHSSSESVTVPMIILYLLLYYIYR